MATRQQASRLGYSGSLLALENDPRFSSSGGGGLTPTAPAGPTYTAVKGDLVLANAATAAWTVTLPAALAKGDMVGVKKTDSSSNVVTVVGYGASPPSIDGDTTGATLNAPGVGAIFVFDGTNWQINSTAVTNAATSSSSSAGSSTYDALITPTYTSQYWYDRRSGVNPVSSVVQMSPNASTIYYASVYLHKAVTIDRVGLNIGNAPPALSTVRLGLYSATATGLPNALLYDWGGPLSLGTTANTVVYQNASGVLPKGFSYFALSFNSAITGMSMGGGSYYTVPGFATGIADANFTYANSSGPMGIVQITATGNATASALAATASGLTVTTAINPSSVPNVYFRVA